MLGKNSRMGKNASKARAMNGSKRANVEAAKEAKNCSGKTSAKTSAKSNSTSAKNCK